MPLDAPCDLHTLYRRTEDYFFALLCLLHRRFSADTCAYFTAQKSSPFNVMFIRVGSHTPDDAMEAALDLMRHTSLEIRAVLHEQKVAALYEVLTSLGFHAAETTTAMVLRLSDFVSLPSERAEQVGLTRDLNEWIVPVGNAFSLAPEVAAHYQARHQQALDTEQALYHFSLSTEGQIRCSLTLSMCEGEARLSDVATLADVRGKGYGTRLIQAALLHAASLGAQRCFLEATASGISVYRKLGFEPLYNCQAFVRGPILPA